MKKIYIDRHAIKSNILNGTSLPVVTIDHEGFTETAYKADIVKDGEVIASVVYDPSSEISERPRVWIETEYDVKT